jgi:hypothetical protein
MDKPGSNASPMDRGFTFMRFARVSGGKGKKMALRVVGKHSQQAAAR